jgi:hypothetical protein
MPQCLAMYFNKNEYEEAVENSKLPKNATLAKIKE